MIEIGLAPEEIPNDFNVDWHLLKSDVIRYRYPKFYEEINKIYPNIDNWMEKIWLFSHGMIEPPKLSVRGNSVKFFNITGGYKEFHRSKYAWNEEIEDDGIIFTPKETFEMNGNRKTERYLRCNHVTFYNFIKNFQFKTEITNWSERIYLYERGMDEPPKCPICGEYYSFWNTYYGYNTICINKCKKPIEKSPLTTNYDKSKENDILDRELIKSCIYQQLGYNIIKNYYPTFCEFIENTYTKGRSWLEKLYLYVHNMNEPPKCKNNCGKYASFNSFNKGYNDFCSYKCCKEYKATKPNLTILSPDEVKEMGVDALRKNSLEPSYPMTYKLIDDRYKEFDVRWMEKVYMYAWELKEPKKHPISGASLFFRDFTKGYDEGPDKLDIHTYNDWLKQPLMKKYFPDLYLNINEKYRNFDIPWLNKLWLYAHNMNEPPKCPVCNKILNLISYGEGYPTYCSNKCSAIVTANQESTREKFRQTCLNTYGVDHPMKCEEIKNKCREAIIVYLKNNPDAKKRLKDNLKHNSSPSKLERSYQDFLEDSWYRIIRDDWDTLKYFELDILHIDYPIAIEINGSYYHSIEKKEDKFYHPKKFIKCYHKGIELITIWEDWDFDLCCQFIIDKTEGRSLDYYKKLWFSDLDDNQWPADLGIPPNNREIIEYKEHQCYHSNFECYDSGIFILN